MENNKKIELLDKWLKINKKLKLTFAKISILDEERKKLIDEKDKNGGTLPKLKEIKLQNNLDSYLKLCEELNSLYIQSKNAKKEFQSYIKNAPLVVEKKE